MGEVQLSLQNGTGSFSTAEVLINTEEMYRNFFENSIDGMFRITRFGRIMSANPAMARIFGYDSPKRIYSFHQEYRKANLC